MGVVIGTFSLASTPALSAGTCLVYDGAKWVPTQYASSASGASVVQVDFGPLPKSEATFMITVAAATPTKAVSAQIAGLAPNKSADEVGMDSFVVTGVAGTGTINFYVRGLEGYLAGKFNVVYTLT